MKPTADVVLDHAIAVAVMGWRPPSIEPGADTMWSELINGHWFQVQDGPYPWSTQIAAALDVMDRMHDHYHLDVEICRAWNTDWRVDFFNIPCGDKRNEVQATARSDSLPRAICEAALKVCGYNV